MIKPEFTVDEAQTLVRVLNYVRHHAEGSGESLYAIDHLCRKDCGARFRRLSQMINSLLVEADKVK